MSDETVPCLYCQTPNPANKPTCTHCGMLLAKAHPLNKHRRKRLFVWFFWAIVVFCAVMIVYLPRG